MKLFIALIASILLVTACSTQQDPLADASDEVTDGNPPDTNKPIAEKPLDKMNLQIDAPTLVNAAVGSEVKFNISGRVLVPGVEFMIYIDNLDSFPGATFDSATGDFTWMPTRASIGTQISTEIVLSVTIATIVAPGRVSTSENKNISIVLVNSFTKPTINSVTGEAVVIGGMSYTYSFKLTNIDATGKDDIVIIGQSCGASGRTLTPYINLNPYTVRDQGNGEYTGELTMDLYQAANLTAGTYCFAISAITAQGKVSDIYKQNVTYEPRIERSVSTLKEINLTVGEVQKVSFSIYDPQGSNLLTVGKVEDISVALPGSKIACVVDNANKSLVHCDALIDARTAVAGITKTAVEVGSATRTNRQSTSAKHTLIVNVKAAPL
ncbi:hypothetical protein D3C87_1093980 [compost metagenome]